jgi:hypothetical protein
MKCTDFELLIDEYIDGTITEFQRSLLEEHLKSCSSCNKTYEADLLLLERVSSLPRDIRPKTDLWQGINQRIRKTQSLDELSYVSEERNRRFFLRYAFPTLAAAMIIVAILYLMNVINIPQSTSPTSPVKIDIGTYWDVSKIKGNPKAGDRFINEIDSIKVGSWIQTDDSSRALLKVAGIGSIVIEPNSKIRISRSDTGEHRIALEYGTIDANIAAAPKTFFVDTKSAVAVDLGCSYTLSVDSNGDGLLYVKDGLVSLQSGKRESLVPAGKFCITREGIGPGTPYSKNTSAELKKALIEFDFKNGGEKSVNVILKSAKKEDAVTLVSIIPRVEKEIQVKVYDRACSLSPPPRKIPEDSLRYFEFKHLNEWIEKVQKEVHESIEKSMESLDKEIQENIERSLKETFENEEFSKELHERINESLQKAHEQMEKFRFMDTMKIDMSIIGREMEKAQKELEKANWELERNHERIQREMERVQEELERANEKRERELERMNERLQREEEKRQRKLERMQEKLQRQMEKDIEKNIEKDIEKEIDKDDDIDQKTNEGEIEGPVSPEPEKSKEENIENPELPKEEEK